MLRRKRKFTPPDDVGFYDGVRFEEPTMGPDARDMDLLDGSWEKRYYQGRLRRPDWNSIGVGLALLVLMGIILPMFLVFFR